MKYSKYLVWSNSSRGNYSKRQVKQREVVDVQIKFKKCKNNISSKVKIKNCLILDEII